MPRVKTCVTIKSTVSYQRVQLCAPSHLCVPRNWWLSEKRAVQRTSGLSWERRTEREREKEKRERSTGTKLTPLLLFFFLYTRRIPSWKLREPRRRGVASCHSLNAARLSFTNRAPIPIPFRAIARVKFRRDFGRLTKIMPSTIKSRQTR